MPRQKNLVTVIRDLVREEVRAVIGSLLGWAAVRHDGGEIGEGLLRGDEIEELGRDRASGSDVPGRMATTRRCSLETVMAEAGTAASEESE